MHRVERAERREARPLGRGAREPEAIVTAATHHCICTQDLAREDRVQASLGQVRSVGAALARDVDPLVDEERRALRAAHGDQRAGELDQIARGRALVPDLDADPPARRGGERGPRDRDDVGLRIGDQVEIERDRGLGHGAARPRARRARSA